MDKFDPHRPYQFSHLLQRNCDFRKAAKGSNKKPDSVGQRVKLRGTDGKPTNQPQRSGSASWISLPGCTRGPR